jgi:uncharacterized protein
MARASDTRAVEEKYGQLLELLRQTGGALVAFSGGVDSSLLLAAAREALEDRAVAAIGRSASYPAREHEAASALAASIGVRVRELETTELEDPAYTENPPDRCYVCKSTLFTALKRLAEEEGLSVVVEGSNADDEDDYRPGMRAARELGIRAPFVEVGMTKAEIRRLAQARGLPVWNKPSLACLASRIPYGSPITAPRLARIDRAEQAIRALGYQQVRVRDHGDVARVELDPSELSSVVALEVRETLVAAVRQAGFRYVALDLEGYRTGAMNEALER